MRNFMSYSDYSITDLSKYKIIFISGKNAKGKSTLTSEAPYFTLFGSPLRYNKISDLLSYYYAPDSNEPAYSELGLVFDMFDYTTNVTIRRNIIGDDRYELTVTNDQTDRFNTLSSITKVPDFNKEVKKILDIDERKFNILYLKSPFSEVLFESDSDLLSSITKSQHINELRKEFSGVVGAVKSDMENMKVTIDKQNSLAESINKQLQSILDKTKQQEDTEKLTTIIKEIDDIESDIIKLNDSIKRVKVEYTTYNTKKRQGIEWTTKIDTHIKHLKQEKHKLVGLTERGKCPTCYQSIGKLLYHTEIESMEADIAKHLELYSKGTERLDEVIAKTDSLDKTINDYQDKIRLLNGKLRSLSGMKAQLQGAIDNFKDNKKNNDEILKKIRNTIMDLNDDLTALSSDYKILDSVSKVMLSKNSEYINKFYDNKIHGFNIIFKSILSKFTKGKYVDVSMKLNNKPTLNGHIQYESLSTSERKFIDLSFVMSYIIYLSTKLKLKTFILDEFLDNYDKENVTHIYNSIYELAMTYDLQLLVTTNMADYLFTYMGDIDDVKIIELE